MSTSISENYSLEVVKAWDEASWNFKKQCDLANKQTSIIDLLETDWRVWSVKTWENWVESVIEGIDWVWTKVQIYTARFNFLVWEQEKWNISDKELFDQSVELWERMLDDLIAMNVDDLRNGEMAVWVTNIIDINHLKWIRWKVFSDSMWQALYNVVSYLDIAMTAWETAILWLSRKEWALVKLIEEIWTDLMKVIDSWISDETKKIVNSILEKAYSRTRIIEEEIDFNIGWTWLWVMWENKKLVYLEVWQAIVYLGERPTKNWIIWPRSNWLTAIRKHMTALAGEGWENLSFIDFLDVIWDELASKIPASLYIECEWLDMWDIATWKTTVFNPFVSRILLWWLDFYSKVDISSIIHVTWNPWRKISEWLKWRNDLAVDLDITKIKLPQIIEILLHLWCMTDEEAISWMNMWVPYALVCNIYDVETIINEAKNCWIIAEQIWCIVEREDEKIAWKVKWVWVNNTEIIIEEESV